MKKIEPFKFTGFGAKSFETQTNAKKASLLTTLVTTLVNLFGKYMHKQNFCFQAPTFTAVIAINFFCISVFIANSKLHSLEYCLVVMQTVFDLTFTGILGLTDYMLDLWSVFIYFCTYSGFNFDWTSADDWSNPKPY